MSDHWLDDYWQRQSDKERALEAAREARERIRKPAGAARNRAIVDMLDAGNSSAMVGEMFGLTPVRVRQIEIEVRHQDIMARHSKPAGPKQPRFAPDDWRTPEDEWRAIREGR